MILAICTYKISLVCHQKFAQFCLTNFYYLNAMAENVMDILYSFQDMFGSNYQIYPLNYYSGNLAKL